MGCTPRTIVTLAVMAIAVSGVPLAGGARATTSACSINPATGELCRAVAAAAFGSIAAPGSVAVLTSRTAPPASCAVGPATTTELLTGPVRGWWRDRRNPVSGTLDVIVVSCADGSFEVDATLTARTPGRSGVIVRVDVGADVSSLAAVGLVTPTMTLRESAQGFTPFAGGGTFVGPGSRAVLDCSQDPTTLGDGCRTTVSPGRLSSRMTGTYRYCTGEVASNGNCSFGWTESSATADVDTTSTAATTTVVRDLVLQTTSDYVEHHARTVASAAGPRLRLRW